MYIFAQIGICSSPQSQDLIIAIQWENICMVKKFPQAIRIFFFRWDSFFSIFYFFRATCKLPLLPALQIPMEKLGTIRRITLPCILKVFSKLSCVQSTRYDTGDSELGCLYFGESSKTWDEAKTACEATGVGHIAEAPTEAKVIILLQIFACPVSIFHRQSVLYLLVGRHH